MWYYLSSKNQDYFVVKKGSLNIEKDYTPSASKNQSASQPIPLSDLHTNLPIPTLNTHPMTTRSKVGIFKPKIFTIESTTKQLTSEPNSVTEASKSNKWKKAMKVEI